MHAVAEQALVAAHSAAVVQLVKHWLDALSQVYGAQLLGKGTQSPAPSQPMSINVSPRQLELPPQAVATGKEHAPAPLQTPEQVAAAPVHSPAGSVPAAMSTQDPSVPVSAQPMHSPPHAVAQQTKSTQ